MDLETNITSALDRRPATIIYVQTVSILMLPPPRMSVWPVIQIAQDAQYPRPTAPSVWAQQQRQHISTEQQVLAKQYAQMDFMGLNQAVRQRPMNVPHVSMDA